VDGAGGGAEEAVEGVEAETETAMETVVTTPAPATPSTRGTRSRQRLTKSEMKVNVEGDSAVEAEVAAAVEAEVEVEAEAEAMEVPDEGAGVKEEESEAMDVEGGAGASAESAIKDEPVASETGVEEEAVEAPEVLVKTESEEPTGDAGPTASPADAADSAPADAPADSADVSTAEAKEGEPDAGTDAPVHSPLPSKTAGFSKSAGFREGDGDAGETDRDPAPLGEGSSGAEAEGGEEGVKQEGSWEQRVRISAPVLIMVGEDMPELRDDTEDVDDVQENEHFETRQCFLNLCQGNHYQFDQLRRAKHTSMMVLYHLHNPDAPKFVPSCSACSVDILTGMRHHCETCDIDFCSVCLKNMQAYKPHAHPLRPIPVASSAPTQMTEEQRKERQRSVNLHMQLLNHAAHCDKCDSKNCQRMKTFLAHDNECRQKAAGGCRLCVRISNLLNIHARACRAPLCKVPHCEQLKEQIRRLNMRQQQMDDRRRQNMNHVYNGTPAGDAGDEGNN